MKPNLSLDKHITTNTKLALQTRILTLFILLTIGLTSISVYREINNAQAQVKKSLTIATSLSKNAIDNLSKGRALDTLSHIEKNELQAQINSLTQHFNCQLYIINKEENLLFTGSEGGPFNTAAGQQLHNITGLSQAISKILAEQEEEAYYDGISNQHLLKILPLESPNMFIVGDTPLSAWYMNLGGSLYFLFIGLTGLLLARKWIKQAITDWRRQNLSQTIMDSLTSLPNRRGMELFLQQAFATPSSATNPHSLLLISLDHFAQVNIHYGTDAGDMILKQISSRIRTLLDSEDLVGRWDGDTFLILHKGISDTNAATIAEKVFLDINRINFDIAGETVRINISIGVHTINDPDTQRFSLAHTEQALRKAKKKEDHHVVYSNGIA